jgi:hypothetical protein
MSTVVESPAPNFALQLRNFASSIDWKDIVMPKALVNEHKSRLSASHSKTDIPQSSSPRTYHWLRARGWPEAAATTSNAATQLFVTTARMIPRIPL